MATVDVHMEARRGEVERWFRGELPADKVKESRVRTVWRTGTGMFVKRFPLEVLRDRARKEARVLQDLEKAGIGCPKLVATARDDGGTYVFIEEISQARMLRDMLENGEEGVRGYLVALGRLQRRLHDAGYVHRDLHVGNALVHGGEVFIIDVHRARRVRSLSVDRKLDDLAFAAMSFTEWVPLTEIFRFLRGYGLTSHEEWHDVWQRLRRLRHKHYRSRQARCMKEGSAFGLQEDICYRRGADLDAIVKWVESGEKSLVKGRKGRGTYRSADGLFLRYTRIGKAKKIWKNSHGLAIRRIATPRLDACAPTWVVGEWIEGRDLYWAIRERFEGMSRAGRNDFLFRLARLVRKMHERGVFHKDLKAGNVHVTETDFLIVDLDRVKFSLEVEEVDRVFNLAQLNASVVPPLTRTERLRFLHYYIGRTKEMWDRRRDWVTEVMRVTIARQHHWPK